jgi:hypothetical protein
VPEDRPEVFSLRTIAKHLTHKTALFSKISVAPRTPRCCLGRRLAGTLTGASRRVRRSSFSAQRKVVLSGNAPWFALRMFRDLDE